MRLELARAALLALLLAPAVPAGGEIYRWTDDDGTEHFTHDLGSVPPRKRAAARAAEAAEAAGSTRALQTYATPPEGSAPAARRVAPRHTELRIPFERRGTLMLVSVRLDDRVEAPFLVDTGASGILLTRETASRLGFVLGPDTPRAMLQTANGLVAEPVVTLDSVQVGAARVEGLEAIVSSSMSVGLLGGAFFNNFVYQIDAAASEITLLPSERMRAGLSEEQWRARFRELLAPLGRLERRLAAQETASHGRDAELVARHRELQQEFERLERAADLAAVPQAWRE